MSGNAKHPERQHTDDIRPAVPWQTGQSMEAFELRAARVRLEQLEKENTQLKFENSRLKVSLTDALLKAAAKG